MIKMELCDLLHIITLRLTEVRELEHFLNNHSEDKFELVVQLELNREVLVVVLVTGAALKNKCGSLLLLSPCYKTYRTDSNRVLCK